MQVGQIVDSKLHLWNNSDNLGAHDYSAMRGQGQKMVLAGLRC